MTDDTRTKVHPAALLFPLIEGDEFDGLVADIKAYGQRETIKTFDGQVLDGRNRLRACEAAGVAPRFEDVTTTVGDPLDYAVSANIHRRQLTPGQRAFLAHKIANLKHGTNQFQQRRDDNVEIVRAHGSTPAGASTSMTVEDAAKLAASSVGGVGRARVIANEAPGLVADVEAGKVSLEAAYNEASKVRSAKRQAVRSPPPPAPPQANSAEPDVSAEPVR
jgi:hypothetical protein